MDMISAPSTCKIFVIPLTVSMLPRETWSKRCRRAVLARVTENQQKYYEHYSLCKLPHFTVGEYVLVARLHKPGEKRKITSTWTGSWRVANDDEKPMYAVQHLVTGETRDLHVTRMRLYAGEQFDVTRKLQDVFRHLHNPREYHMEHISATKQAAKGNEYFVNNVDWKAHASWCRACRRMRQGCCRRSCARWRWRRRGKWALKTRYSLKLYEQDMDAAGFRGRHWCCAFSDGNPVFHVCLFFLANHQELTERRSSRFLLMFCSCRVIISLNRTRSCCYFFLASHYPTTPLSCVLRFRLVHCSSNLKDYRAGFHI